MDLKQAVRRVGAPAMLAAGVVESVRIVSLYFELFSVRERLAALFFAAGVAALLAGVADAALKAADRTARRWTAPILFAAWTLVCVWFSTQGRVAAASPFRIPGVVAIALAAGWAAHRTLRIKVPAVWALLAGFALAADFFVLPRLYFAFHLWLKAAALLALVRWAQCLSSEQATWRAWAMSVALVAGGLLGLALHPNVSFVLEDKSIFAAPMVLAGNLALSDIDSIDAPPPRVTRAIDEGASTENLGIDASGASILLITVDALRADRTEGTLTPAISALAATGTRFRHAYTPTPHTSYALSSMLTGKYLREVLELDADAGQHTLLPELLRNYGYRTAAFYPPAIFFVDGDRFQGLASGGLGFEYRKEMFASAADRVTQLEQYLQETQSDLPVFVWVHLFEPHEPYDPPREFRRGDSAEELYDAEVRAVDDAVAGLTRVFAQHRSQSMIVLAADHGEEFGEHGGYYHGTTLFEEQIRIPLVVVGPGVAVQTSNVPVNLTDVAPTILAALGVPRDARMTGRNLGAILRGAEPSHVSFSSVGRLRMVTDGRFKLMCERERCRTFDLREDPSESLDRTTVLATESTRLQGELARFLASIPEREALALSDAAFPEAVARLKLGDTSAVDEVLPLLSSPHVAVRREVVRLLGENRVRSANASLRLTQSRDSDPLVRSEAALSLFLLGDSSASEFVEALLVGDDEPLARRAAFALARTANASGRSVLERFALDDVAAEEGRLEAIALLGALAEQDSVPTLLSLLSDVRMRPAAVDALGRVGGRRALDAVAHALAEERYVGARTVEAQVLVSAGDRRAPGLITRFLGVEEGMPDGVRLLVDSGSLSTPSGRGALATARTVFSQGFSCTSDGCIPGPDAVLKLPSQGAPRGDTVLAVLLSGAGDLTVNGSRQVGGDRAQLCFPVLSGTGELRLSGTARIRAVAVVPRSQDLPPPPPEPWEEATREAQ